MRDGKHPLVLNADPAKDTWNLYHPQARLLSSLFALSETVEGLTAKGVKYPLENHTLTRTFPLGVSNEFNKKLFSLWKGLFRHSCKGVIPPVISPSRTCTVAPLVQSSSSFRFSSFISGWKTRSICQLERISSRFFQYPVARFGQISSSQATSSRYTAAGIPACS